MTFKLEEMPGHRVAYMRQVGPYGADNKGLMEKLKSWAASNKLLNESAIILGIAHDNPAATLPENCRYDVCIVVPEDYDIKDENISETELSGGRYAVFTLKHTAEDIEKAWGEMMAELSGQGRSIDPARPIFERYVPGMVAKNQCELCVPV